MTNSTLVKTRSMPRSYAGLPQDLQKLILNLRHKREQESRRTKAARRGKISAEVAEIRNKCTEHGIAFWEIADLLPE